MRELWKAKTVVLLEYRGLTVEYPWRTYARKRASSRCIGAC